MWTRYEWNIQQKGDAGDIEVDSEFKRTHIKALKLQGW